MREILFRGKRKDNGEWVYGWLGHLQSYNPRAKTISTIYFNEITEDYESKLNIIVDYKTVGQYTGLTDKNGTKIFEGDILKQYDFCYVVSFENGSFVAYETPYNESAILPRMDWENAVVIGNIHDNPELLVGGVQE